MKKYCILLLAVIFVNCKKENGNHPLSTKILGRWELKSYGGGLDGKTYNVSPDSVYLEFKLNKTYQQIIKGQIKQQGTYQLGQVKSIYNGQTDNAIKLGNTSMWSIISVDGNKLSINSNAYDGGGASYVKK